MAILQKCLIDQYEGLYKNEKKEYYFDIALFFL